MRTRTGRPSGGSQEFGSRNGAKGFPLNGNSNGETAGLSSAGNPAHAGDRQPNPLGQFCESATLLRSKPCIESHDPYLHHTKLSRKCILSCGGVERQVPPPYHLLMARKSDIANAPNAISTWRTMRGWKIEDLAEQAGLSSATVSRIENGGAYSQDSLEKIATALRKETWMLLLPPRGSRALLELVETAVASSEEERNRILGVLRALSAA